MTTKTPILSLMLLLSLFSAIAVAQDNKDKDKDKKPAPDVQKPVPDVSKADKIAPTLKPAPLRKKGEPLDLPEVDGWEKAETVKYPQRELGYIINYDRAGGSRVSVYVYNGGRTDIKNSLTGPVKEEIERAKAEIDTIAEMGLYTEVKVISDEKTKLGGKTGKIDVLRKVLSYKARGNALHSEIIIFPFEGDFVKFRATRPKATGLEGEEAVNKLLAELEAFFLMYMEISDAAKTAVK